MFCVLLFSILKKFIKTTVLQDFLPIVMIFDGYNPLIFLWAHGNRMPGLKSARSSHLELPSHPGRLTHPPPRNHQDPCLSQSLPEVKLPWSFPMVFALSFNGKHLTTSLSFLLFLSNPSSECSRIATIRSAN